MKYTPKSEIYTRIDCFKKKLTEADMDGSIILLNSDIFYFTGTVQNSFLYIPTIGEPVLMVKRGLQRALEESPLKNIVSIKNIKQIPEILHEFGYTVTNKIGMELDVVPFNTYKTYKKIFLQTEFYDISNLIKEIRAVKSPYEIELLHNAIHVIDEAFLSVPSFLKEGMSEVELASLFEAEMRKGGYSGSCRMRAFNQEFFYGNVCTGESGFYPSFFDGPVGGAGVSLSHPQGAGWKKIKRDEVIYIDYTCIVEGYSGDQTRIFCMGELTPKMVKAFEDAVLIQSEIVKAMKPGISAEEPYFMALKLAEKMGYKDNFMGYKENQVKFLGHGIGLELDEWPVLTKGFKMPIVSGMTFAMEPKFVFPEGAIGIENSFVMTENGPQRMSTNSDVITYVK
ncbi:M24 family metallopeptidase [Clostridium magnum]|uniref:Xaa-Pro dipeptidase n=1 Tax=Clostridium magnum DSM 2767 TaxID=1121326 RepID=A0A162S3A0_9CLOT|nr:Xaa-Pro peptidase family protein [Clostridium magnum]KZL90719.1 Xaa-Pro dipeptidase [Clostridium magnum DSM 2767]SHI41727.1 Xaa-Pro aminopeptidase [Clostridium magnum DSM 2767]